MPVLVNDVSLYVKFINPKFLPSFLKRGEIYFGSNRRYQNIETKEKNNWIGDKKEGVERFNSKNLHIKIRNEILSKNDFTYADIQMSRGYFCCTQISGLHDLIDQHQKNKFINDMNRTLLSDKRYPKKVIVFKDFKYFLNKVRDKLISSDIHNFSSGPIIYSNNRNETALKLYKDSGHFYSPVYWINMVKDKIFSPEREYRINIPLNNSQTAHGGLPLDIGPMNDNIIIYNSAKDFFDNCINNSNMNIEPTILSSPKNYENHNNGTKLPLSNSLKNKIDNSGIHIF